MATNSFQVPTVQVSHIGDYNQAVPDDLMLVEADADYVTVCHALRSLIGKSDSIRVWVRQESHYQWLRRFSEDTGIEARFDRMTPRLILAEQWGVSIPEWLDDQTVLSQNLLGVTVQAAKADRFSDAMLLSCLGPSLLAQALSADNLSSIVSAVTQPDAKQRFAKYPILNVCLQEQCNAWSGIAKSHWVEESCRCLADNPENLWRELTLWALLAGYPAKLLEYVVSPERVAFLQSVPRNAVESLSLHAVGTEQASAQIDLFFKDITASVKTANDFLSVLACVSGRLPRELRSISCLLDSGQFQPTRECVDRTRTRFSRCPGISPALLDGLKRLVRPTRPTLIGHEAIRTPLDWIAWAVNEYTPYRHWQTFKGHNDPRVEEDVQRFSDWYMSEYVAIHQDSTLSLVHALTQRRESICNDELSIILLVDCLPLAYWDLLERAMSKVGFSRHRLDYGFAPLPTVTEYVKPRLVSGTWEPSNQGYEVLLKTRAIAEWGGKLAIYLATLEALVTLEPPCSGTVILLNLLPADGLLHSDVQASGTTYDEELHRVFTRLADSVKGLFDRWIGDLSRCGLYVVTDHGATMILDEEKSSLDSKVIDKLFPDARHRFAVSPAAGTGSIPDNLWALGYRFTDPFSPAQTYFIPRGHNTVRQTQAGRGYVHGGASPEEVIVPSAEFRPVRPQWQSPSWRFLDLPFGSENKPTFYVCRMVRLRIELQNRNAEPLRVSSVELVAPVTEVKNATTAVVGPMSIGMVDCDCYFAKDAINNDHLLIQLSYEVAGTASVCDIRLPAIFKSAITGGFRLKDI